ncbi:hypothetical protein [Legionella fairfieldensis]|uniref:hypothetical protein n=1 Tax=Legionella fairfieldensis TaxID=45064 RepID=UPI00048D37AD|nr:hypothetical protein [Legionella fairfieldensis]
MTGTNYDSIAIVTSVALLSDEVDNIETLYRKNVNLETAIADANIPNAAKQRADLALLCASYGDQLADVNPASFIFLTKVQQKRLRKQIQYTHYLFCTQYALDSAEGRKQNFNKLEKTKLHCEKLLGQLTQVMEGNPLSQELDKELAVSGKYLKYLGLTLLAQWFAEKYKQFMDSNTHALTDWLTEINDKRRYWIWGGGLLASALALFPDDFLNKQQTSQNLAKPAPIAGYMSWILYYTRFGISLLLLLKHTFKGPWMNEEEKALPASTWERFQTQWQQRKFVLLNDSIWATANLICFFWLKGSGMLGYAGNAATAALLLIDLVLLARTFWEESTQHNKNMQALQHDMEKLENRVMALQNELYNAGISTATDKEQKLEKLKLQLDDLQDALNQQKKMKRKAEFEWKYKCYTRFNDLAYSMGLIMSFCVLCSFFFPPAAILPATSLLIGFVGAALSFALTVAYAAVSGSINIAKSNETKADQLDNCNEILNKFKAIKNKNFSDPNDENMKKLLYLDLQNSIAKSDYHQRIARFQTMQLVRSILVDAFIPAVIFASLMFLPLGAGIGVIAAALTLAWAAYVIINRFEPQAAKLPEFNEARYAAFESAPSLEHFMPEKPRPETNGFWGSFYKILSPKTNTPEGVPEEQRPFVSKDNNA